MRFLRLTLVCLFIITFCFPTNAFFEQSEVGARFLALGGAGIALDGDVYSQCWNPASIHSSERQIGFSYSELYGVGIQFSYYGFIVPTEKITFGGYKIALKDPYFDEIIDFSENTYALVTSFSPHPKLSLGVSGKWMTLRTIENIEGFTVNVGMQYLLSDSLRVSVNSDNLIGTFNEAERLVDSRTTIGIAINTSDSLSIVADYNDNVFRFGTEKSVGNLTLRAGYYSGVVSAGLGVTSKRIVTDYAFTPGFVGNEHRIAFRFVF